MEDFWEIKFKFLYISDLFKVNKGPVIPMVLFFDERSVVEFSFWLLHNCWYWFFFDIVGVDESVVISAEELRLQDKFLDSITVSEDSVVFVSDLFHIFGDVGPAVGEVFEGWVVLHLGYFLKDSKESFETVFINFVLVIAQFW